MYSLLFEVLVITSTAGVFAVGHSGIRLKEHCINLKTMPSGMCGHSEHLKYNGRATLWQRSTPTTSTAFNFVFT